MRIAVGSDDVYHLSKFVVSYLRSKGHVVEEIAKEILDAFLSVESPDESELDNIRKVDQLDELKL